MGHISGVTGAAPIWHDFMEKLCEAARRRISSGRPAWSRRRCAPIPACCPRPIARARRTELFLAGTAPTAHDNLHRRVRIDRDTGELATANCPPDRVIERVFTILPAEAQEWARDMHLPQPPTELCELHPGRYPPVAPFPEKEGGIGPPFLLREGGQGIRSAAPGRSLVLTHPDQGSVFRVSPQIPLKDQCIEVAARPGDGVEPRNVALLVDGVVLSDRAGPPPYQDLWCLRSGEHRFQARGVDAAGRQIESQVVQVNVQ